MLIAQDQRRVEQYSRTAVGWNFDVIRPPKDRITLSAIKVTLALDEIYEDSGT